MRKVIFAICLVLCALVLTGCSQTEGSSTPVNSTVESSATATPEPAALTAAATALTVCFGDQGKPFALHLYDNDTAAAIARHVGTADWRLPIYHFDDYENWEVMQYYDIPARYEIPSNPKAVTSERAGEVYYSEPNRIILFYGDGEVNAEYTPVGYFDPTEDFISAVENNPVLEGWGNKLVLISPGTEEPAEPDTSASDISNREEVHDENTEMEETNMVNLQIGEHTLKAKLAENSSAQAFAELLAQGPVTVQMHDYGSMEKVGTLPATLPENNAQITTEPGDLILYQGNSITIYYDTNNWSLTRLGKVQDITQQGLKDILGDGDVEITFSLNNTL